MKVLKASLLIFLCFFTPASFAQKRQSTNSISGTSPRNAPLVDSVTGNTVFCKGPKVPEGFVIAGEMFVDACNGSAWIIKRKAGPPPELDRMSSLITANAGVVEPVENLVPGQCDAFQQAIKSTYNFNPAQFSEVQVKHKSVELDAFWNSVRQSRATLVPCLRKALKEHSSDSFFNIDGSMLLVDVDPSPASKALQVRKFIQANLDGTDLEYWVRTMARRGVEGFDVSEAGAKWLSYPNAKYNIALHGGYPVGSFEGAVFIFGSMEEDMATPVLLRIANQVGHPHRQDALLILMSQATLASFRALTQVDVSSHTAEMQRVIRETLENPRLLKPRAHPKLTREENLRAFQGIVDGDYSAFREMVLKAPDGEVDAVATLKDEDIPLVRRARRASIARCNQHALADFGSFTQILWARTWKPGLIR